MTTPSITPPAPPTPDWLAAMSVLQRREIEARIVGPLVEALSNEFGRDRVRALVRDTILQVAREQGRQLASTLGGNSLTQFAQGLEVWKKDQALEMELLENNSDRLWFNVTRCRYAELYQALGLADLGATLSCNRDAALIEGFNPEITLTRTQTIMDGAPCCNFRYQARSAEAGELKTP